MEGRMIFDLNESNNEFKKFGISTKEELDSLLEWAIQKIDPENLKVVKDSMVVLGVYKDDENIEGNQYKS